MKKKNAQTGKSAKKEKAKSLKELLLHEVHFFFEGGTSMYLKLCAPSIHHLEERVLAMLAEEGPWMRFEGKESIANVQRHKIIGFNVYRNESERNAEWSLRFLEQNLELNMRRVGDD